MKRLGFFPFSVDDPLGTPVLVPRSSPSAKVKVKYQDNIFLNGSFSDIGVIRGHCPLCLMSTSLVPKSRSEHVHNNCDLKL